MKFTDRGEVGLEVKFLPDSQLSFAVPVPRGPEIRAGVRSGRGSDARVLGGLTSAGKALTEVT